MNTEDMENYNRGLITFLWPALKIWRLLFGNQISVNNSTWYCYSKITAEIFKVKYQAESGVLIQLEQYSIHYFKIWLLQFILYWVLYNNKRKCCHDVNCNGERDRVGSVPLRVILPKHVYIHSLLLPLKILLCHKTFPKPVPSANKPIRPIHKPHTGNNWYCC